MNANQTCFPFRTLLASLLASGFGGRAALTVPANDSCRREPRNAGLVFPSRRGQHHTMTVARSVSLTTGAFGVSSGLRRPDPMRESGKSESKRKTPNHALQRTPGFGVQLPSAALIRPAQSRAVLPAMKPGTARAFASRRRAAMRVPGPESLSLGSLGVVTPLL